MHMLKSIFLNHAVSYLASIEKGRLFMAALFVTKGSINKPAGDVARQLKCKATAEA